MVQPYNLYLESQSPAELVDLLKYIVWVDQARSTRQKVFEDDLKKMFQTHNAIFDTNENGIHCSSCVASVSKRLSNLKFEVLKELDKKWHAEVALKKTKK